MVKSTSKEAGGGRDVSSHERTRYCGIVRPIAEMGDYSAAHWRDIHNIISEAVEAIGLKLRLVSESDTSGVILTEIVSNLYQDEMVIVDVSGKNPNVMFELGMRLAFEKPAIIIKDDDTSFTFDISPVKHIVYPRSLRYGAMLDFKRELAAAITATLDAGPEKKNYLQQFGPIKVTELGQNSVDMDTLAQDVQDLRRLISTAVSRSEMIFGDPLFGLEARKMPSHVPKEVFTSEVTVEVPAAVREEFANNIKLLTYVSGVREVPNGVHVTFFGPAAKVTELRNLIRSEAHKFRSAHNSADGNGP